MDTVWTLRDYATERQIEVPGSDKNYTVRFSTMTAMINAAWQLTELYERWEAQHFAYIEVNRDAFAFDSRTGALTFRDSKKIVGRGMELTKEQRVSYYSAPELIRGDVTTVTTETQNWTLAMLLFDLFYHGGHPLGGTQSFLEVFLSPEEEYEWYAAHGVFNMEDNVCKNRPVHGIQGHLIRYWDYYPEVLQNAFTAVFLDGKDEPEHRLGTLEWKDVLNRMKSAMPCNCGYGGFIQSYRKSPNGTYSCPRCGKIYYALSSGDRDVYISNGTEISRNQLEAGVPDDSSVVAMVVENRQRKGVFGVKNMSDDVWKVTFPDQSEREIARGQGAPIWPGLSIRMPNEDIWSIKQS